MDLVSLYQCVCDRTRRDAKRASRIRAKARATSGANRKVKQSMRARSLTTHPENGKPGCGVILGSSGVLKSNHDAAFAVPSACGGGSPDGRG